MPREGGAEDADVGHCRWLRDLFELIGWGGRSQCVDRWNIPGFDDAIAHDAPDHHGI